MKQHIPWTEVVRDIILLPLKCCLTNEISDDDGDHPVRRESINGLRLRRPIPRTTDATPLLNQPNIQRWYVSKKTEFGENQIQSYYCFLENEAPVSIEPTPVEDNEDKGQWDPMQDGNDDDDDGDDAADDQGTEFDPFEYDNAPEYRDILGRRVSSTSAYAQNSDAWLAMATENGSLAQDLYTIKRMLEVGLKALWGEGGGEE